MKLNLLITGVMGLAALGAITGPTTRQPSLAERVGTINNDITARQRAPDVANAPRGNFTIRYDQAGNALAVPVAGTNSKPGLSTGPAAVILGLQAFYKHVDGPYGGYNTEAGQIVAYSTVSSNAPSGITDSMNAADALAICWGAGLTNLMFSQYGIFVLTR